ncbi:MAG: ERCC4 domain-containing protein [Phycisphaeraceae bacterium]|nr:ERCC4 domain-containing protein [Phycisphaeraceae bacterium]
MDFRIVIDTREQQPYGFPCATERRKLDAGDYSVDGRESLIAVERKSLADFVRSVIHDGDRFHAELERLAALAHACIVVEADLDAVLRGLRQSDLRMVTPRAVLGAALQITIRYRVPVQWCGSRQAACAFTEQFLRMAVREGSMSVPEVGLPGVAHA